MSHGEMRGVERLVTGIFQDGWGKRRLDTKADLLHLLCSVTMKMTAFTHGGAGPKKGQGSVICFFLEEA